MNHKIIGCPIAEFINHLFSLDVFWDVFSANQTVWTWFEHFDIQQTIESIELVEFESRYSPGRYVWYKLGRILNSYSGSNITILLNLNLFWEVNIRNALLLDIGNNRMKLIWLKSNWAMKTWMKVDGIGSTHLRAIHI